MRGQPQPARVGAVRRHQRLPGPARRRGPGPHVRRAVFVTMRNADRDTVEAFEQAVATIPNVLTAQRPFSDPDYHLQVVARDLRAFQKLYDERISTLSDRFYGRVRCFAEGSARGCVVSLQEVEGGWPLTRGRWERVGGFAAGSGAGPGYRPAGDAVTTTFLPHGSSV
ncbi:Lrp/AsnC ligand binding domain-containing protein [Arthrobacter sp. ZGTC131]|uniref:Lrp/AsnC ligand binding domain-containing protein n=1 Tax=Arthrobacter sp. ZGTC131 TaxID=2058898 RepID=UPI0028007147|nr:Lrp/AsnC ligand binding domain-containing protein [Arthrobacter sp. ZGTC131]